MNEITVFPTFAAPLLVSRLMSSAVVEILFGTQTQADRSPVLSGRWIWQRAHLRRAGRIHC